MACTSQFQMIPLTTGGMAQGIRIRERASGRPKKRLLKATAMAIPPTISMASDSTVK